MSRIVSLDRMKTELRIPLDVTDHDAMIGYQIEAAMSWVSQVTGHDLFDNDFVITPGLKTLEAAVILLARDLYNGSRSERTNSLVKAMVSPVVNHFPSDC